MSNMKKLVILAMLCCMIMACASNGKQSSEDNGIQKDSLVIEQPNFDGVVSKDTIDIEAFLDKTESALRELRLTHIKAAEDTLKYKLIVQKWDSLDHYAISNLNRDEIKHSVKVRYMQTIVDFLSEIKRLSIESKEAGIKSDYNDEEMEEFEEMLKLFQKQLSLETQ